MTQHLPQLGLIAVLILLNAAFAGAELALVSLRDAQLRRLESRGRPGAALAKLAGDPNRFLAAIQVGITFAGFLASASAAVSLAQPLEGPLGFLGDAAEPVAVVVVTIVLAFVMLVLGELVPKRLAMQRAERWALLAAGPLSLLARIARPVIWLLGISTDLVVRLLGGDPNRQRDDITEEELRDMVATQRLIPPEQRAIISGAFEISARTVREVMRPRTDVLVLDAECSAEDCVAFLIEHGYSRAPVGAPGDLDHVVGVVHLRDLIGRSGSVAELVSEALFVPEPAKVLDVLRQMQAERRQLAVVVGEHGGGEGIVTVEDLVEELVGEIYDESDRDILSVEHRPDGSLVLPGRFPIHDLVDLDVELPAGEYATVAGLVLAQLGSLPEKPGESVAVGEWRLTVLEVEDRAITKVNLLRIDPGSASVESGTNDPNPT